MSFAFEESILPNSIIQTEVADGISLRIEPVDRIVSRVYFVDTSGAEVPIPEGFEKVNLSHDNTPVRRLHGCMNSYRLTHNGEVIFELSSQRECAIFAPQQMEFTNVTPH